MNLLLILLAVSVGINLFYLVLHMSYHSLHISEESKEEFHMKPVTSIVHTSTGSSKSVSPYSKLSPTSSSQQQCEGVAMTLLLHAPKWFQRRYTIMVSNVVNNIPATWCVVIYYTSSGASQVGINISIGIQKLINNHTPGRIRLVDLPAHVTRERKKRYQLMYHPYIWSNLPANDVFVFGGNSVICSNSPHNITYFTNKGLDYLGAPWDAYKGQGGDGGISLRKRDSMLKVIEYASTLIDTSTITSEKVWQKWGTEDHFFVKTMLTMMTAGEHTFKLASRMDTLQWSAIGSYAPSPIIAKGSKQSDLHDKEAPFAASGTLPHVKSDKERETFLQYCPELKVLYPSIHNPNCFGAEVHSEECAASICALQPNKKSC